MNTSKTAPRGHWVMIARKNNMYFYADSYQKPIWMHPNVQLQLDGSRLEFVKNQVVEQSPNSCRLFVFILHLNF